MPAFNPAVLAPVQVGSTTLAVANLNLDPAIRRELFRGGGTRFGSALLKLAAQPAVSFRTPFKAAYDLLGLGVKSITDLKIHLARFTDFQRATGSTHRRWTAAAAAAWITGAQVEQGGILWAEVMALPLSSDGLAAPMTAVDTSAIPTLGTVDLHTLGPLALAGVRVSGLRGAAYESGIQVAADPQDGDTYLRTVAELAADPRLVAAHRDPIALLTSLGLFGTAIGVTPSALWFRDVDADTGAALDTGMSLSCSAGAVDPASLSVAQGQPAEAGLVIHPITGTDTHPIAATFGGDVP